MRSAAAARVSGRQTTPAIGPWWTSVHASCAALLERSGRLPLGSRRVLDLGCGDGDVLAGLVRWGALPARLTGVDVRAEAVARAHARWPDLRFEVADATVLPHRDASFDLVLCFTLFTSILDDGVAQRVAGEIRRVLRPGGGLVWYDFRVGNPWNPHVRGRSQAHTCASSSRSGVDSPAGHALPPLARRLHALTPVLYPCSRPFRRCGRTGPDS
jgi:SAM-dependent methyltransferase